jgi:WD40 repeat protein
MARPNFGPKAHGRARQLLASLLLFANDELEGAESLASALQTTWQTNKRLVVRTKIRFLEALTTLGETAAGLNGNQIKEALKRFDDHLGILADNRTASQGSDVWHFTLNLWYPRFDIEKNLQQFDCVWEQTRPQKSRQVAGALSTASSQDKLGHPGSIDGPSVGIAEAAAPTQDAHPKAVFSWGEAIDVAAFYGREEEITTLEQWILRDRCRLIALLGMGGIGKTALSVKLAKQLAPQFEGVVWRSLRNAPPIQHLLDDLLLTLSQQQRTEVPSTIDGGITALLQDLQSWRVLLVLDNVESILEAGQAQGAYRPGYEDYGHLIRSLSESPHRSCVILTSREKPIGLSAKEGPYLPIRSYQLKGVEPTTADQILRDQGIRSKAGGGLIDRYNGNPLALKIAIATIQDLFGGDVAAFLAADTVVFGDIADLLAQQVNRLSPLEWQLMQWLSICREPVSLVDLQKKLVPTVTTRELLTALTALQRRSLVDQEPSTHTFTQQPVVMEYVTERIIGQCVEAFGIDTLALADLLNSLALMEADAKDYIRQTQRRVIINPIAQQVKARLGTAIAIREPCDRLLAHLHANPQPGYAAGNLINLMHTWPLDLTGYDFSHLSIWQIYLQNLALPATNFTGADLSRAVFTQTLGGVLAVTFHPDGQRLATAISNEVVGWDICQSKQLFAAQGHTAWILCLTYSPDQTMIASGSRDETIRLWDAETGQCLKTLACPGSWIQTLVFSPDGEYLVSGGSDGKIRLWHVATASCQRVLSGHGDRILSLKFTADGRTLVSGSQDKTVAVWDFESGDRRHTWNISLNWALAMDLSPDGRTLVTGSDGKTVKFWDLATGDCLKTLPGYASRVWSVAFSPDGKQLLTASEDKSLKLWDVATGECLRTLLGHTHSVWLAASSADGRSLVSASNDQTVKVWEVETGHCCQTFTAYSNWIQSIAFSPNGQILASGGEEYPIRLWQTTSGTCQRRLAGHTNQVSCVVFSPAGDWLASGSDDATIRLWNPTTGDCLRVLQGHRGWVQSVAFSPRKPILVSGSHDHTVRLWDVTSGECLQTLEGHLHRVKTVACNPDGRLVASGSDDHTIKVWEVESGVCVQTLEGHSDWVLSVAFHPDRPLLASGSGDRTIRLWDLDTGDCLRTLTQHTQRIRSVTFSPDGQRLASGGDDGTVRFWNSASGKCLQVIAEHTRAVWTVAFSPDGKTLASCSEDETIRFWNVVTGECLKILRPQRPYEGMTITDVVGLTPAQRNTLIALGAVDANLP